MSRLRSSMGGIVVRYSRRSACENIPPQGRSSRLHFALQSSFKGGSRCALERKERQECAKLANHVDTLFKRTSSKVASAPDTLHDVSDESMVKRGSLLKQ